MLIITQTALELGFLYAPVALALFLSYRILDIADLTTDGCFVLGAAVSVSLTAAGHPFLAIPAAMLAGACAGLVTAFLQTNLGVPSILAGIVTNTGLYTVNLMAMGWKANQSLLGSDTVFTLLRDAGIGGAWYELLLAVIVTGLAAVLLRLFLGTHLGLSLRATGDNPDMVRASSLNPAFTISVGLCLANAMTGLAGAMVGQYQKTVDINSGTGIVVIGLACLIIGETVLGRRSMTRGVLAALVGSLIYRFIYAVVFTVIGFICLIMLSSSLHNGQMFMLFPILLPYLSFLTFALGSFGAVGITASGNIANLSLFGISNQYVGSISAPWQLWLVFVAFLITTFYIALRAAARNIYDPAYAGWQHSWKSPVATLVIWLIVTFLFTSATLGYTMQSDTYDASLNIAAWYFLVAAVWSFLIEVVALTFGPAMVLSMGGAWKLFVGGTVRPTPAEVTAYAAACGAYFGRFPSQVAAAAGYTGPQPSFGGQPGAGTGAPTAPAAGIPVQGVPVQGVPVQGTPIPGAPVQGVPAAGTDAAAFQAQGGAPTVQVPAGAPAAPAAAPVAPVPVAAPAAPAAAKAMTPQQKKLAIIISAIVGVLALLGIAYAVVNSTVFSADNTAKSYLSAIASGDYDKANGISDPQVANGKRTLLTNAASKGDKTTISNQRIISATDNADGSRTMRISYTLGGKSMTDILTVAPNGSKFLIFKNWNITTPLVKEISVYASPAITNFTVNGVKVGAKNATASDSGTYTFNVYPGSYTVKPVTSKYLTADSTTLTTSSESSASISAEPTDALADEINAKIKDKLDTCAKSTDAQPEGCPFSMYGSDDDYRNIAWNITEYPTVTTDDLSIDSGSFYVYGGEAKVAYEYKNYDDSWEPTDSSTSFSISGQFTLDGDKLDITLDED